MITVYNRCTTVKSNEQYEHSGLQGMTIREGSMIKDPVFCHMYLIYTQTHAHRYLHAYIHTYTHALHMLWIQNLVTDIRMWSKYKHCHVCTCTLIWKIHEESPHPLLNTFKLSCMTVTYLRPLCWFILALGATPSTAIKNNFWGWIMRNKTCRKRTVNIHMA